mmetsp:Transcript_8000/g.12358  ORF Transcript_8000/g.12358 Transcript_8000/m.12358 type:complete len:205 (-) Transcript_8000:915-1529(-)
MERINIISRAFILKLFEHDTRFDMFLCDLVRVEVDFHFNDARIHANNHRFEVMIARDKLTVVNVLNHIRQHMVLHTASTQQFGVAQHEHQSNRAEARTNRARAKHIKRNCAVVIIVSGGQRQSGNQTANESGAILEEHMNRGAVSAVRQVLRNGIFLLLRVLLNLCPRADERVRVENATDNAKQDAEFHVGQCVWIGVEHKIGE